MWLTFSIIIDLLPSSNQTHPVYIFGTQTIVGSPLPISLPSLSLFFLDALGQLGFEMDLFVVSCPTIYPRPG